MPGREIRSVSRETPPIRQNSRRSSRERRRDSRTSHNLRSNRRAETRESRTRSPRHRNRSPNFDTPRRRRDNSFSHRECSRDDSLNVILQRLNALENRLPVSMVSSSTPLPRPSAETYTPSSAPGGAGVPVATVETSGPANTSRNDTATDAADRIVGALSSLFKVRSTHYYISNFDPSMHDFDMWAAEVDRGRDLNNWDDRECLGRIGGCLKGDARSWLGDWVTNDRTWTNFKAEFRSLCPREVDMASVLFEVMNTNSNKFSTYAEYARKSLMRLNIVKGISDELKAAIVVRGITDPQVKAATTNAKLQSKDLVEFLSVYLKPKNLPSTSNNPARLPSVGASNPRKREHLKYDRLACFLCGSVGHKQVQCPKKPRSESNLVTSQVNVPTSTSIPPTKSSSRPVKTCTFCKKSGHLVDSCFARERIASKTSDKTNTASNVNFCLSSTPNETM